MDELELLLRSFDALKNVSDDTIDTIKTYGVIQNAPAKTCLFHEREESLYVYFVIRGIVSIYKCAEEGKNKVIFMLQSGDFINEDNQNHIPSTVSALVFEEATLLCIPRDVFFKLMQTDPKFMEVVYCSLSKKLRRSYRQLKNLSSTINLDKKVASKLYKLGKDYGIESARGLFINLDLSITYLSDMLGVQRESCSRAVNTLIKKNLILYEKKHFYIMDIKKLGNYFKL